MSYKGMCHIKLTLNSKWWENRKAFFERDDEDVGNQSRFTEFQVDHF